MAESKSSAVVPLFQALPTITGPAHAAPVSIRRRTDGKSIVLVVGLAIVADTSNVASALNEGASALESLSASLRAFAATPAV